MFQDPGAPSGYSRLKVRDPSLTPILINALVQQERRNQRFSDVSPSDPAMGEIGLLARAHMLPGINDRTFAPGAPFTRSQLATTLVALVAGLKLPSVLAAENRVFSDVPATHPAASAISAATRANLIVTPSATTFGPGDPVSRQDFAVSLARVFHLPSTAITFADKSQIAGYAQDSVAAVVKKGYLAAPAGTFQPTATLTREQAAVALFLALRDNS